MLELPDISARLQDNLPDNSVQIAEEKAERFIGEAHEAEEKPKSKIVADDGDGAKALLARQSGIRSWEKFVESASKDAKPQESENLLAKLSPEQREELREKGEIPKEAQEASKAVEDAKKEISARLEEALQRLPDSHRVVPPTAKSIFENPAVPDSVKQALDSSPVLIDVLYAIGGDPKNLQDFVETAKINPGAAIRKLALIEGLVREELNKSGGRQAEQVPPVADAKIQKRADETRTKLAKGGDEYSDWPKVVAAHAAAHLRIPQELDQFLGRAVVDSKNPAGVVRMIFTTEGLVDSLTQAWNSGNPDFVLDTINSIDKSLRRSVRREAPPEQPVTRVGRPPSEVGGRNVVTEDPGVSAVRANDFRSAKTAWDRQYASRHKD